MPSPKTVTMTTTTRWRILARGTCEATLFAFFSFAQWLSQDSYNIFDNLPCLVEPKSSELRDELDRYLSTDPEQVDNVLVWWNDRSASFPSLSRMALNYLSIPATSVDVERVFSRGRLLLSHTRSRLSAQTTRCLLCLGSWSPIGLIKDTDIRASATLPELDGEEPDVEMPVGWDNIVDSL